ncbi:GEVED domain-containing protein [Ancylomarina sp. YFZ004]
MKHFTFLIVLLFLFQAAMAQQRVVNSQGNYKGVIRVKFNNSFVQKVDVLSSTLERGHKLKSRPQKGFVVTQMKAVDKLNERFIAKKMKRVFRESGKHEAKHRQYGLHLWYEIEFSSKTSVEQLISTYENLAEVSMAQAIPEAKLVDYSVSPTQAPEASASPSSLNGAPNDPRFVDQWHYENTGQNGGTPGSDISLLEAWTLETGNSNVVVAIEDGGIDWDHEDLAGNMWVNPGEIAGNGVDDDNNGYVDDIYGYNFVDNTGTISVGDHGTHVAGTVAAETNNGIGVAGVAGGNGNNDGVRLMSCNVFTDISSGGFEEAFIYAADNGAVISQNSWGYSNKGVYDQACLDAIDYFVANAGGPGEAMNGGLVIIAAGNDDSSGLWYPGCYDSALAVGATNCKDEKSWYSNYDSWVDISAPGGELISTNNDPTAIHSTLPNNQYGVMQGTSMACPHVSGVAALIVSKNYGNITAQQAWDKLVNTTDNIDATIPTYLGKLGSGRMNAFAALDDGNPPAIPSGLVATNILANAFDLQWNATGGASSYDVQIRENSGVWSTFSISTNNYSYTGATPETNYEFQLRAVNSAGNSDYTAIGNVTTLAMPPIPAIPTNITANSITADGFTLNWNTVANADDYDVQLRPQGGSWTDYNTSTNSLVVSGLLANTGYDYQIRANNTSGSSDYSTLGLATTAEAQVIYCESKGNNANSEWIAEVGIGNFTKSSEAAGYSDFTSEVIDLTAGSQYAVSLTPGFSSSTYNEYWKIWIDYNKDGIFNDAEELAFDAGSMSKTTVTGNMTIPANAVGSTRMRVSMKYNGVQTACEAFSYGEVEDYTVSIQAASQEPPVTPDGLTASNITTNSFTIAWNAVSTATSYDLQIREQGGSWNTITNGSTTYDYTGASEQTTYEYQVRATNNNGSSAYSATSNVTTNSAAVVYCESKGNNANSEWIAEVGIGNFTKSSEAAGYSDFTSEVIDLTAGSQYVVSLTPGFSSSTYNEYWKIWIDYNKDGIFNDAEELAFDAGSMSKTTVTGNMTIPANAVGSTRMRVSMKYNGVQTACEAFSYGEVEDYTVSIQAASQEPPVTPDGLTASNITTNSFTIAWNAVSTATSYDLQIREQGGSWNTITIGSTTYDYTGASEQTTYEYQVRATNNNGSSAFSATSNLTTNSAAVVYCDSKGNNSSYEWIDLIQLGSIDNSTGNDGGYADYTSMTTNLAQGSSQTIYFSVGFNSSSYTEFWNVWIDYNHDGNFDASEKMVSGSSSSSGTLSGDFTVPSDANLGTTRMRVSMKYNYAGTACETFSYGEVEDYTVNITNTGTSGINTFVQSESLGNEIPKELITISPNPAEHLVTITTNQDINSKLKLISINGHLIRSMQINSDRTELDVSGLPSGTYLIVLDGVRDGIVKKLIKK